MRAVTLLISIWTWLRLFVVAITAGDDHLKLVPPLTAIDSIVNTDGAAPEDALDLCRGSRIGARCIVGILKWISLEVDVDGLTAVDV